MYYCDECNAGFVNEGLCEPLAQQWHGYYHIPWKFTKCENCGKEENCMNNLEISISKKEQTKENENV